MANVAERRTFNILGIFDGLEEYLNTGDPAVREWFLVKSNFWPIFLCSMYVLTVKVIGPAIMRDRKPFGLRKTMIVFNLFLVSTYIACVTLVIYCMRKTDLAFICEDHHVSRENHTYIIATCGWVVYLLKYVEFLDTIFFVLRKKNKLITNLHVIHHFTVPMCGWFLLRTERNGFQAHPVFINAIVHIFMYSYYGIAAIGPSVRKYLWWKRYLTIAQMIQFILIILCATVVLPLAGCSAANTSAYMNFGCAALFLALFNNFYRHSFKTSKPQVNGIRKQENGTKAFENGTKKEENGTRKEVRNGDAHHDGFGGEDTTINCPTKIKSL